jgi:alkylation response protein AidB-like acyl-CoA dehydrogenase
MAVVSTQERESIRQSARGLVRERAPVAHLRALRDSNDPLGYSRDLWRAMAELGFAGMLVPDRWGGTGLGYAELGIVSEELGRNLVPTPILAGALGGGAVLLGGSDAIRERVLRAQCTGERTVALALDEGTRFAPYSVATRAEQQGSTFVVRGDKSFVVDGHLADAFVVVARTSGAPGDRDGLTLLYVPADTPGVRTARLDLVDSRNVAQVHLDGARVDDGAVIEYLKTRRQFGVFIGSFQALKHRAAWMFCEIELTRSLVLEAFTALDAGRQDASVLVSAAKARASDTYILVTNEAVQMHGGVGVTDELDIGFYMKRARVAEHMLGAAPYHRDRFAKLRGF